MYIYIESIVRTLARLLLVPAPSRVCTSHIQAASSAIYSRHRSQPRECSFPWGGERHNRGCASEGWPVLRVFLVSRLSSPLSSRNLRVVEGEWPGRGPAWWAKV